MPPPAPLVDADEPDEPTLARPQSVGAGPQTSSVVPARTPRWPSWEGLSDEERRLQLDAMDTDDVRSFAATLPLIEQAKGVLMGCYGVDATAAFAVLRRLSSSHNLKLRDLCALVVTAVSAQEGTDQGGPSEQVRRALEGALGRDGGRRG